ncbi:phospholipase D family protein [Rhodospira trueperi]|uniref:PLD-like domain-containing protein n=1 Tax=Rhodospira trueperi TaxID=69960 RepID=A0A1G7GLN0_9PROT|nr:phospholipase D family protein [Rhodospira trueperi]SDE89045.1 PLD-like domain-containing protein [Rhodospira trueperi]
MMVRLVDAGWGMELTDALRADANALRIICPFIKAGALERLLRLKPARIQVITRFNLADFAEGVSDVPALRILLDAGARVRGIRNLHAKLYLFGASRAIITSANLTKAALDSNHEFGVVAKDAAVIGACRAYFDDLWQRGGDDLTASQVDSWTEIVNRYNALGGRQSNQTPLEDFGAHASVDPALPVQVPTGAPGVPLPPAVADAPQAFVKFLGEGNDRKPLNITTISEIERAGCHWAVAYPANRRPSGVQDDAVIFIARLTRDPNDIRIFGRAIGMKYQPGRDDATPDDIARRAWKEKWPRYIRVHHAEFVAGTMANGVSLNALMDTLGADSFAPTQRNAARGDGNTNPRKAYLQQAAVELSKEGRSWLAERLQAAFDEHGVVPRDTLDPLDWPMLPDVTPEGGG